MADEAGTTTEGTTEGETTPSTERTFTQVELDRIVQDRLARERGKFADYDEVKSKAERLDEIEAANASELEKAVARAEKAEQALTEAQKTAREVALRSSIIAEAAKPERNIVDPEGVITFLTGPDAELLSLKDDGSPTNVAEAMDKLLERRAYLVAAEKKHTPSADQGARGGSAGQISRDELKSMTPKEIVQARREGRLDDLVAGH